MPLTAQHQINTATRLGLWRIDEPVSFFMPRLSFTDYDQQRFARLTSEHRQREWLASRLLLKTLVDSPNIIHLEADSNGRPLVRNMPLQVSISHSGHVAAAIVSEQHPVGIDVEMIHDRIQRIAYKFVGDHEWAFIGRKPATDLLTLMWSAKESVYKIYGKRVLAFSGNIFIHPFEIGNSGWFYVEIKKTDFYKKYQVHYRFSEAADYVLTHVVDDATDRGQWYGADV